jgi:hypothetical protein
MVAGADEPSRPRLVGVPGFEPGAFRSQSGRAAKLRHTPLDPGGVTTRDNRRSLPVKGTPYTAMHAPGNVSIMVEPPD